ncbi:MAG: DUF2145 domain-containing protein [Robiginitomaculum sp.]|nr:DUF2145 domain-containing protein [Robiginitomaculum sp.]
MLLFLSALVVGIIAFGQYLNLEYRTVIASTQKGDALFSKQVLDEYGAQIIAHLNASNVEMAIVSRSGQPRKKLPEGISFTHSAFWLRNGDSYDVYNLYHGEDNRLISSLVTDTAADFLRLTREHDVGIILPKPSVQIALADHIKSVNYARVHQVNYSLISNPLDTRFQNCNEFMLDVLAAFAWGEYDADAIKFRLATSFKPTEIKAGFIRRNIAPFIDERLVMADHGKQIFTTTRLDLQEFLESENMLDIAYVLPLNTANN